MILLTRTVRVCVNPDAANGTPGTSSTGTNTTGTNGFGGTPPMAGLGRYYEFDLRCKGEPDPDTGYLINIKDIDRAVRRSIVPELTRLCDDAPATDPVTLVPRFRDLAANALGVPVVSLTWRLTPTYTIESQLGEPSMPNTDTQDTVVIRQQFDFAASHRLHVEGLSDEENRATFGKCNNPSGHGHNYRLEIAARVPADGSGPSLAHIEPVVDNTVIDRFDHTYLNVDTEDFGPNGVNPSVEHIAKRCHELLTPALSALGATLQTVTVWETDRTCATYPG